MPRCSSQRRTWPGRSLAHVRRRQHHPVATSNAGGSILTDSHANHAGARDHDGVVLVRSDATTSTRQQLPQFVGISAATAGARSLSMNLVVIPPGGAAAPHLHDGYETAIYILQGEVDTRYGPGLARSLIGQAGDFLFIAQDVPHQPVNLSKEQPAIAIVARNDANEQESVRPYDPTTS